MLCLICLVATIIKLIAPNLNTIFLFTNARFSKTNIRKIRWLKKKPTNKLNGNNDYNFNFNFNPDPDLGL